MSYGYIYGLMSPKGKWYIGQTTQEPYEYIRVTYKLGGGLKRPKLKNALKKYGYDSFMVALLDSANSQDELDDKENDYITEYNSINKGYNTREGGSRGKHSEESKIKMSNIAKGKKKSEETKKRISIGLTGKHRSEETKKRISIGLTGIKRKPFSEEHRKKISETLKSKKRII